jgi:hypothetical protein
MTTLKLSHRKSNKFAAKLTTHGKIYAARRMYWCVPADRDLELRTLVRDLGVCAGTILHWERELREVAARMGAVGYRSAA